MTKSNESRYTEGIGRRKTSVARVRITKGTGLFVVNDKKIEEYLQSSRPRAAALAPFVALGLDKKMDVTIHVAGGGIKAQGEAIRHGMSRALVLIDPELKKQLHTLGFLTRDSRKVERKKYGLKKARRAPQWAKR